MPDESFDAVIIGGGSKALYVAMYLTRYAGMSVGIFEKRHEVGGGLATEEIPGITLRSGAISRSFGNTEPNSTNTFAATAPSSGIIRPAWPSTVTSMT
jgi:phytoene dehydrogenase-like protein